MQRLIAVLERLEHLRGLLDSYNPVKYTSSDEARDLRRQIPEVYGEVEEVYRNLTGDMRIEVKDGSNKDIYCNYFEAGYLSGRTFHSAQGYSELAKVIGRVKSKIGKTSAGPDLDSSQKAAWQMLHPKVRAIATDRFEAGHFADAVEAAFKALNSEVKSIAKGRGASEMDGATLMHTAFSPKNPIIALADLGTQTGRDMQQGYMELFAGAMSAIRNPKAHENIDISPERGFHMLCLASLLWETLDGRV